MKSSFITPIILALSIRFQAIGLFLLWFTACSPVEPIPQTPSKIEAAYTNTARQNFIFKPEFMYCRFYRDSLIIRGNQGDSLRFEIFCLDGRSGINRFRKDTVILGGPGLGNENNTYFNRGKNEEKRYTTDYGLGKGLLYLDSLTPKEIFGRFEFIARSPDTTSNGRQDSVILSRGKFNLNYINK